MAKGKKEEKVEKKVEEKEHYIDTDPIKEEVMAYVDSQMDWRIEKVIQERVKKEVFDEIEKANRKVVRSKNRKIFVRDIFIVFLIGVIVFLTYLLYQESFFDSVLKHIVKTKESTVEKVKEEEEEERGPTLEEYIQQYGSYLDSYTISSHSIYAEDFFQGSLTDELKNYFTLQAMNFDEFTVEDDYHVIDAGQMKKACSKLFSSDCNKKSFEYNGEKLRYFQKLDSYVTNTLLEKTASDVTREIVDIQVNKNTIVITTVEGLVVDGILYSVYPQEEVSDYYDGVFQDHRDSLNRVIYTFKDKKLTQIQKG